MKNNINNIGMVLVQFSFPDDFEDLEEITRYLPELPTESEKERSERKNSKTKGREILTRSTGVSVFPFIKELEFLEFFLTSAFYQKRKTKDGRPYYIVRFVFSMWENIMESGRERFFSPDSFQWIVITDLALNHFWRVRGYINPMISETRPDGHDFFWSINAESATSSKLKLPAKCLTMNGNDTRPVLMTHGAYAKRQAVRARDES